MNRPYTKEELSDGRPDEDFNRFLALRPEGFRLHMPNSSRLLFQIFEARLMLLNSMNSNINYFLLRHRLPLETKRATDVAFLLHYTFDHLSTKNHGSPLERLRFYRLWYLGYGKEVNKSVLMPKNKKLTDKEKEFLDLYNKIHWYPYLEFKENDLLDYFHNRAYAAE